LIVDFNDILEAMGKQGGAVEQNPDTHLPTAKLRSTYTHTHIHE